MKHFASIASLCALFGFAGFGFAGPASAASAQPAAGGYSELTLILSTSVSGAGVCDAVTGGYYNAVFYYPGPAKAGAYATRAVSLVGLFYNLELTYPKTPAAGATTWSGKIAADYEPGDLKGTIKFSSTIVYQDNHSFMVDSTLVYPTTAGGTCTSTEQDNYILLGK